MSLLLLRRCVKIGREKNQKPVLLVLNLWSLCHTSVLITGRKRFFNVLKLNLLVFLRLLHGRNLILKQISANQYSVENSKIVVCTLYVNIVKIAVTQFL